jgi:hypothetical protein
MEVLESVSAINENGISQKVTQKIVKNIKTSELKEIELTFLPKDCQCRIHELLNGIKDDELDQDLKSDVIAEVSTRDNFFSRKIR